jgi:hypothetical protein
MKKLILIIVRLFLVNSLIISVYVDSFGQCTDKQEPFKENKIPGVIEFEDFDKGCLGEAYSDTDEINHGGQYRTGNSQVDIEVCSEGGFNVGWNVKGEWLEYTVNVQTDGNYNIDFRIASGTDNNKFHLEVDGVDATGIITLNTLGGLQDWKTISKNIFLAAGKRILRFVTDNGTGGLNLNKMTFAESDKVWNFDTTLEGWNLVNQLTGTVSNSILNLTITGDDPFMHSPDNLNILAATHRLIKIRMKNNTGDTGSGIYFTTTTNTGFSETKLVKYSIKPNDTDFTEYVVDMGSNPEWKNTIKQIRVDPVGSASSGTVEIDYIKIAGSGCSQQTITFKPISGKKTTDGPFTVEATATSGLPVEFKIASGPAKISENTITLDGTMGLVVVAANQSGDVNWCQASEVKQSFFVENPSMSSETVQLKAYGDNWVATDATGRIMPGYEECGDYRAGKYVGMFYWLWHADISNSKPIRPVPEILRENPDSPPFEVMNYYHDEPENGYYHPSDPWSTRRNLQMLANAGVDFVFFDFTNGNQGCSSLDDFMSVALDMYNKGIPVPKISFFMNENYDAALTCVMEKIYSKPQYDPLIFKWEGKPLLMADTVKCATQCELCKNQSVIDHFTWRKTWAFDAGQWNFLDTYPQDYFIKNGKPEQMPVSKAMGAPIFDYNLQGSSSHNKKAPPYNEYWETDQSQYGFFFEEQWSQAHAVDPDILCITGWNELMAGAWPTEGVPFMGKQWNDPSWRCVSPETCIHRNPDGSHKWPHGWHFVDQFNTEFNRDLEPLKGHYTDSYFYQLVSHIRKFKGMNKQETISDGKTINIDGDVSDWAGITPRFIDAPGDVVNRNFRNVNNTATLSNTTARNDITESGTTYDNANIYFFAKTLSPLSAPTGQNWMLLFIDVDRNKGTGWEGYDYVVNLGVKSVTETTLKQWDGVKWINEVVIPMTVKNNILELSVPRSAMMMDKKTPEFYFHWADNPQHLNDITSFFTDGESAPDRRFNYNFSTSKPEIREQSAFKELNIPGTIEFEDFDNGGAGVAYADADIANQGGKYRNDESVDIAQKSENEYYLLNNNKGEWLEYTIKVNAIGKFRVTINYSEETAGSKVLFNFDDQIKTDTIFLPSSSGKWSTFNLDLQLTSGQKLLKFLIIEATEDLRLDKVVFSELDVVYPGTGNGLEKTLWTGEVGGRNWFKDSVCTVIDPVIDETWADVSPGCNISIDFWNVRWRGQIEALYSEEYTFYLTVNDLGRLWVNDVLIIDAWTSAATGKTHVGKINLAAGQKVNIRVDFAEKSGDAKVKLEWESKSNSREVVPQNQLYPALSTSAVNIRAEYIKIFPNPTSKYLTINSYSTKVDGVIIVDVLGRNVYTSNESFSGLKTIYFSLEGGIYFVKLKGVTSFSAQKISIH